jgi:sulfur-oxidizing protein SoxA
MRLLAIGIAGFLALAAVFAGALFADAAPGVATAPGAKSGYDFIGPDLQKLQDDDFANPGLLWVDAGAKLWAAPAGPQGLSCQSCHGDAAKSMRTVATRYPAWSPQLGRVISLEQQINHSRTAHQHAAAFSYESQDLLALTAFIAHQAKGLPMNVTITGPAAESFAGGKAFFYQRRGQLDLSCANCHEQHVGDRLRGEVIDQGQINGFPIYRELWQTMGSIDRMFAWCNQAVRAEPYPAGSQPYVDLELFERWRGRGLLIETPAVRR